MKGVEGPGNRAQKIGRTSPMPTHAGLSDVRSRFEARLFETPVMRKSYPVNRRRFKAKTWLLNVYCKYQSRPHISGFRRILPDEMGNAPLHGVEDEIAALVV